MDDAAVLWQELIQRFQQRHQEGTICLQSGQYGAAEEHFEGAVELARFFVQSRRDTDTLRALSSSLSGLAVVLDKLGANPETVPLLEEAAEVLRELALQIPSEAEPALVDTLIQLAKAYRGVTAYVDFGQPPTLDLGEMKLYRLERMASGHWRRMSLGFVAPRVQAKAEAPLREAIPLLRLLVRTNRTEFEGRLALSLNLLGETLIEATREAEAEAPLREAEALYRKLAIGKPNFESMLSDTLSLLNRIDSDARPRDRVSMLEELVPSLRAEAHITDDERENGMSIAKASARDRLRDALTELADLYRASGQEEEYRGIWDRELGTLMSEVNQIRWA